MIDATFALPTSIVSNTIFNGMITFASAVTMVEAADFTLTAVDGNGITNVSFTVTNNTPTTYSLNFTLPADAEGAFSVTATGMVLPDGQSQEVAIVANPAAPIITYDTSVAVVATWGTVDYTVDEVDGQVAIPITFATDVVVTDAAVFRFDYAADADSPNDSLEGLQAAINGEGTDWTLTLTLPLDVKGSITIHTIGEVFKVATMVYDTVTITPLTFRVNMLVPDVIRREQAATYTHGEIYDVVLQFNVAVEFFDPRDLYGAMADEQDFFVFSGAELGTPTVHVYTGTETFDMLVSAPLPDTLGNDWEDLFKPNASTPAGDIFLMRYPSVNANAEGASLVETKEGVCYNPGSP